MPGEKEWYNSKYNKTNYFGSKEWLYRSYVSSLVAKSGLSLGATVLDAGCGQGLFSYLFHKQGLRIIGIDLSETGIRSAKNQYGAIGINFIVGDVRAIPSKIEFDCVFTRACSLYNTKEFSKKQEITDGLMKFVKKRGIFIFAYNTKLNPFLKNKSWIYQTLNDVRKHFMAYPRIKIYVVNRLDLVLFKKNGFNLIFTKINVIISKLFGVGVEIIVVVEKD